MSTEPLVPLADLIAFLPDPVYWMNKEGIYQGCNEAQARRMGLVSPHEIAEKRNQDLACFKKHPELAEILDQNNRSVIQSAQAARLEEKAPDAQGVLSSYLSHKVPLKNSEGHVIGLLSSSYPLDEIKAREDQLIAEKENAELTLKSIISRLPGHVYWKDKEGRYLGCNDKQAHSLGFESEADLRGKTDFELPWPEGSALKFRENDLEVMNTHQAKITEEKASIDGKEAVVLSQKVPLKNKADQIIGTLGISLDITELKAAQEREKKAIAEAASEAATNRAIMVFSGMIAHDLRTPLATARMGAVALNQKLPGLIETYQKASEAELEIPFLPSSFLKDLAQIPSSMIEAIQEANAYIDASLKSLKAASQGGDLLSKEQLVLCDAERLLRRSVKDYPYKSGDEAKVHLNTEVTFNFMGNEIFVSRLFENLIKNAFEQIQLKGKGEIFIQTELSDAFNHIKLKDTAGGVTPSIIDQVNQGEMKSSKAGGTGVGLSSAKHTMEALGGKIEARLLDTDCIEFVLSFPRVEQ